MTDNPRSAACWTYGEHSSTELGRRITATTVAVQPIGAVEHHGAHLPLSTDVVIAEHAAAALATDHPELDVLVLPTLAYGLSSEHLWAAGTISLSPSTVLSVLDDLGTSLARAGIQRLAFLNAHGGNTHLLQVACRELRVRHRLMTFVLHPSLPPDHGGTTSAASEVGLGIHGGHEETSLMLHLRPDLVTPSAAAADVPTWLLDYEHVGFGRTADFGWTSQDLTASGVSGDPTGATADDGKQLFAAAVDALAAAIGEIQHFQFPSDAPHTEPEGTR